MRLKADQPTCRRILGRGDEGDWSGTLHVAREGDRENPDRYQGWIKVGLCVPGLVTVDGLIHEGKEQIRSKNLVKRSQWSMIS